MKNRFDATYTVENAGSFWIDESDIDDDATEDDLRNVFQEAADYDLRINGSAYPNGESEFIEWARGVIEARKS